jgi:hypothetical protein
MATELDAAHNHVTASRAGPISYKSTLPADELFC